MELRFGNQVRSDGRRIGYLAGAEVDAASRRVTRVIFSHDGRLGSHAQTRPIESVQVEGRRLLVGQPSPGAPTATEPVLLSRSVRLVRGGRPAGHVAGIVLGEGGAYEAVVGRHHWWSGRVRLRASDLDLSQSGEVRVAAPASRAA